MINIKQLRIGNYLHYNGIWVRLKSIGAIPKVESLGKGLPPLLSIEE
jgi:hypothetical protein